MTHRASSDIQRQVDQWTGLQADSITSLAKTLRQQLAALLSPKDTIGYQIPNGHLCGCGQGHLTAYHQGNTVCEKTCQRDEQQDTQHVAYDLAAAKDNEGCAAAHTECQPLFYTLPLVFLPLPSPPPPACHTHAAVTATFVNSLLSCQVRQCQQGKSAAWSRVRGLPLVLAAAAASVLGYVLLSPWTPFLLLPSATLPDECGAASS